MEDVLISGQNLCKYYREPALDNVSFEVQKGSIFGLVGKNGAGKTTLIRIAAGQIMAASGELSLFGAHHPRGLEQARRRMGCMIETPSFFPYLTAEENLEHYRIQRGIQDKDCVKQALQQVGLANVGRKKFKNFSLGMKQRLGLALAILGQPELLLLDEPINGLDPMGIVEFREILLKLNREQGVTILISSHILSELSSLATHYGFLEKGRLLEQVSAQEIEARCRDCLAIRVIDTAAAAAALEQMEIRDFEVLPEGAIRIYSHLGRPQDISAAIVKSGAALLAMEPKSASLEDYFLQLIGGAQNVELSEE